MPASPRQPGRRNLSFTQATADALHALDVATLPREVRARTRHCIVDFLACAFAARELPWANQAIAFATASSGVPQQHAASIVARVPAAAAAYPGCDSKGPFEHVLQAKMSIHYNVAAALCTGNFDEQNYLPGANPRIARAAELVELVVDEELSDAFPHRQGAEVTVTTLAGDSFTHRADDVAPASDALVRERFLEAAELTLGAAAAGRLAAFVDGIESAADAGELARLTTTGDLGGRIAGQAT